MSILSFANVFLFFGTIFSNCVSVIFFILNKKTTHKNMTECPACVCRHGGGARQHDGHRILGAGPGRAWGIQTHQTVCTVYIFS